MQLVDVDVDVDVDVLCVGERAQRAKLRPSSRAQRKAEAQRWGGMGGKSDYTPHKSQHAHLQVLVAEVGGFGLSLRQKCC